ncbi:MAG: hypothetical protein CMJ78_04275 [Planctomycetaceae bacterium]|nr:hypothetical protein [Planctomycetaceae bacterium]
MQYAHEQGVIHRDIKPGNLLMDASGKVKVLDLGLARMSSSQSGSQDTQTTAITVTGSVMGTVDYMAPEQALNSSNADERSDIYSLGCTFYHLVTGEVMYAGTTVMETLIAHRENPLPTITDVRDNVPQELEAIFHRMVAKHQDDRFQTMEQVISQMETCIAEFGYSWMMRRLIDENRARG